MLPCVTGTIEYFDDGSYGVITYEDGTADWTRGTVTKTKSYTYYNNNDVKQWKVSLTGTFTYTGSSATCTSASKSYTIYNNAWRVTSASVTKSGRTATASFTVKQYTGVIVTKTVNKTLTLTCSNSGVVS